MTVAIFVGPGGAAREVWRRQAVVVGGKEGVDPALRRGRQPTVGDQRGDLMTEIAPGGGRPRGREDSGARNKAENEVSSRHLSRALLAV